MPAFLSKGFHKLTPLIALLDFLSFQVSLTLAYVMWIAYPWHGNFQYFEEYTVLFWGLPFAGIIVFRVVDLYKPEMGIIGVREQSLVFKGIWITYFMVFVFSFFYREVYFSRLVLFYSIFFSIILISTERFTMRLLLQWMSQKGIAVHPALIYGAGYHGQRLQRWIQQSPRLGIRIIGYLDDHVERLVKIPVVPPVLGDLGDLKRLAEEKKIAVLFIAHRNLQDLKVMQIFRLCRSLKIKCYAIPSLYQFQVERIELQDIGGIPLVGLRIGFARSTYEIVKRGLDVVIALFLLCLTLPIFVLIAVVLRMTSHDPIFFSQQRVGRHGRPFQMYKFRTLKTEAFKDQKVSPELLAGEKKIDAFRNFLRISGLDELPQFFNVLIGNMSLVGPRPEMPFLVEKYGPLERERLTVNPGITGLWQISEDRKRLLIHENMDYDLYYIEHMSFNLDLAILLKTIFAVIKRMMGGSPPVTITRPGENKTETNI